MHLLNSAKRRANANTHKNENKLYVHEFNIKFIEIAYNSRLHVAHDIKTVPFYRYIAKYGENEPSMQYGVLSAFERMCACETLHWLHTHTHTCTHVSLLHALVHVCVRTLHHVLDCIMQLYVVPFTKAHRIFHYNEKLDSV